MKDMEIIPVVGSKDALYVSRDGGRSLPETVYLCVDSQARTIRVRVVEEWGRRLCSLWPLIGVPTPGSANLLMAVAAEVWSHISDISILSGICASVEFSAADKTGVEGWLARDWYHHVPDLPDHGVTARTSDRELDEIVDEIQAMTLARYNVVLHRLYDYLDGVRDAARERDGYDG